LREAYVFADRQPGGAMSTIEDRTDTSGTAMRRASVAHREHEQRIGAADPDWPDWYAGYMVAEQAGTELPT
jgi:hypothetical protein